MLTKKFWNTLSSFLENKNLKEIIFYTEIGTIIIPYETFGYKYIEKEFSLDNIGKPREDEFEENIDQRESVISFLLSQEYEENIILRNIRYYKTSEYPTRDIFHRSTGNKLNEISIEISKIFSIATK